MISFQQQSRVRLRGKGEGEGRGRGDNEGIRHIVASIALFCSPFCQKNDRIYNPPFSVSLPQLLKHQWTIHKKIYQLLRTTFSGWKPLMQLHRHFQEFASFSYLLLSTLEGRSSGKVSKLWERQAYTHIVLISSRQSVTTVNGSGKLRTVHSHP